jgi:sugar phosphate isomerase/epimerase
MTESIQQPTNQTLACSEWGLREIPISKQFELLEKVGIRSIELGFGGDFTGHLSDSPTSEEIKEIRHLRQHSQIETRFCAIECLLTETDPSQIKSSVEHLKNQLTIAAELGVQTVNLVISKKPTIDVTEETWNQLTEALKTLSTHAELTKIRIALMTRGLVEEQSEEGEFYIETIMTNRESLTRLANAMPSHIGFGYEPGMFKAVNPSDLRLGLDIVKENLEAYVLQDWKQHFRFLKQTIIGKDDLNYHPIIAQIPSNIPAILSIPPSESPEADLKESLGYFDRISGDGQS